MSKLRVHELAKELELDAKAILEICEQLGIGGKKSHSSALSDDEADKIRRSLMRKTSVEGSERQLKKEGQVLTERRLGGNIIRRRKKDDAPAAETAATNEDHSQSSDNTFFSDVQGSHANSESESKHELSLSQNDSNEVREDKAELNSDLSTKGPELATPSESVDLSDKAADQVSADQPETLDLDEVRKRHDIRAPKVLGKIELEAAPQPVAKPTEEEKAAKKNKKKKVKTSDDLYDDNEKFFKKAKKKTTFEKGSTFAEGEEDADGWRLKKKKKKGKDSSSSAPEIEHGKRTVKVNGQVSVGELAKSLAVKSGEVIGALFKYGIKASINELLDVDTATIVAEEFGGEIQNVTSDIEDIIKLQFEADSTESLELRPPVVTVMGHVDHGKTSLLDAIRKTSVTAKEVGGITQHIGAYAVKLSSGSVITFLDTPGHEAFTAMRSRGAKVTDIVVLVIAADDGVMPQTIEAINHAKAANVPIVVALNKIDKPDANADKVKNQLAEYELVPEEWGGTTIFAPVSAKTRDGLDSLLENLALQSEILELKANPNRSATGTVIESKIDKGRGPVATVLIQNGTINRGDMVVCGSTYGRIRALISDSGENLKSAGPSTPVEILGLNNAPLSGDDLVVLKDEATAKNIAEERERRIRAKELAGKNKLTGGNLTMESLSQMIADGSLKELPLIVKADVQGSTEAVVSALERLTTEETKVKIIHKGVGALTENDVQLAVASKAILIGFNIRADSRAALMIESTGVNVIYSRIIYDLVDQVLTVLKGLNDPKFKEKTLGRVEVRQTFKVPKGSVVAGSYVLDGIIQRGASIRLLRDNKIIHEGKLSGLRRFKDDVKEVQAGYECGLTLDGYNDIHLGDIIEVYKVEQIQQ